MIDVNVSHNQGFNSVEIKLYTVLGVMIPPGDVLPLKQATVNQEMHIRACDVPVTTASNTTGGAVMLVLRVLVGVGKLHDPFILLPDKVWQAGISTAAGAHNDTAIQLAS